MSTLFPKAFVAYRQIAAYNADGIWTEASISEIPCTGSIQPMSGSEVSRLAANRETDGMCRIFSNVRLQHSQQAGTTAGDYILWRGLKWELIQEQVFDNGLLPHFAYVAECRGPQ